MGLFTNRPTLQGKKGVPVWFMRQAGRYHSHYQNIKKDSNFMEMCKNKLPVKYIALLGLCFDVAILFQTSSSLLNVSVWVWYESALPLVHHLHTPKDLEKLHENSFTYDFQSAKAAYVRS